MFPGLVSVCTIVYRLCTTPVVTAGLDLDELDRDLSHVGKV